MYRVLAAENLIFIPAQQECEPYPSYQHQLQLTWLQMIQILTLNLSKQKPAPSFNILKKSVCKQLQEFADMVKKNGFIHIDIS
jgi:hypothetical protein